MNGLVDDGREDYVREFPAANFAMAKVVADHALMEGMLLIESKYIRGGTTPSKATEGIAADLVKYPSSAYLLFVVFDPDRAIASDTGFAKSLEEKRESTMVVIVR